VSLFYAPPPWTGLNVVQLGTGGHFHVCRGYIWKSSGLLDPDTPPVELDERIRTHFRGARWTEAGFYIRVDRIDPRRFEASLTGSPTSSTGDWAVAGLWLRRNRYLNQERPRGE
jgi:hypothetical protein